MARPRVKVYLVKHLSWAYNDECTVPHSATFEKAFRTRAAAELCRRELEVAARAGRDGYWTDDPLYTDWDGPRVQTWLAQFGLPNPPGDEETGRDYWSAEWLAQAEAQLGRDEYLRFCEMFDRGGYLYQVIETELEL